jgi:hypothetical protein
MRPATRRRRKDSVKQGRDALSANHDPITLRCAVKPLLAALAALVVVFPVHASVPRGPTMSVVEVPLHGERAPASVSGHRFDLVGLHWRGTGTVRFRTHAAGGSWSAWRDAAPEADDLPDAGTTEARRAGGWRLGSPWWVGNSDRIEYRLRGEVMRLRAYLVASPVESTVENAARAPASAAAPLIVPRSGWSADESIRRDPPQYADALRFAVVHHTAGANGYSRAEAPAVVRAIELYHVKANGWNDIGYNFLVDRFGTVYEGRYGGIDRNVVGAHALGFNRGSVGIAVLGTYVDAPPPTAALDALARLLAWRLDLAHVDPLSTVSVVSGGSERYRAGTPVALRAVSGHLDTGLTACPGQALYSKLAALAAKAESIGLPKIYAPLVSGELGGEVRFQATLSGAQAWSVTVADQTGAPVASGNGVGRLVDWAWDSSGIAPGSYGWRIAMDGATPASGTLGSVAGAPATLELTGVSADPETISPNGDGVADSATVSYTTTAAATDTVTVADATGQDVATLAGPVSEPAGTHSVQFAADGLADGRYTLRVDAADAEHTVSQSVPVVVMRTLGSVSASPAAFSPNADGRADRLTVRFTLLETAATRVRVLRDGSWVATLSSEVAPAGAHTVRWDGAKRLGRLLDGAYTAVVDATTPIGTSSYAVPFVSDTQAPTVRILPGRPLRVWVSEPARLTVRVDGHPLDVSARVAGVVAIPWRAPAGHVRVVAWDAAGNASKPVSRPGTVRRGQ